MTFEEKRKRLVESLKKRGVLKKQTTIDAMLNVKREEFLPESVSSSAYVDSPLAIGSGQTISAPHMNAMMCEHLDLKEGDKVLEVGTGSGYHAALCAEMVAPKGSENPGHVYTIERHEELAQKARENLEKQGYGQAVTVVVGDGTEGYPEASPYDKILVTAASPKDIPKPLLKQLADGGLLCIPAGSKGYGQNLYLIRNKHGKLKQERICGVRFVPLIGKHGFED